MKLQYELRFNPDCRESKPSLYVWNSDPQLDLELAAIGMEIDAEIGSDVVGNTRYYLLKGIC